MRVKHFAVIQIILHNHGIQQFHASIIWYDWRTFLRFGNVIDHVPEVCFAKCLVSSVALFCLKCSFVFVRMILLFVTLREWCVGFTKRLSRSDFLFGRKESLRYDNYANFDSSDRYWKLRDTFSSKLVCSLLFLKFIILIISWVMAHLWTNTETQDWSITSPDSRNR